MQTSILYYYHDPMCSWCWGYRPTWEKLQEALPNSVQLQSVLGGLAEDTEQIMPRAMQQAIAGYWKRIEQELGTPFNFDFWDHCTPRRDTYKSCRAVIAASQQQCEAQMILTIQKAYYLEAKNPSEIDTLLELADRLELNVDQFQTDLHSDHTEKSLQQQIQFSRQSPIHGFPSLVLSHDQHIHAMTLDYKNHRTTLAHIDQILNQEPITQM